MNWLDDTGKIFIIFGGINPGRDYLNDTWLFHREVLEWTKFECGNDLPDPRSSHSSVVFEDALYIYGGLANDTLCNDLWRLSVKNKRWGKIELYDESICRPLYAHEGGLFIHEGQMRYFIFGGLTHFGENSRDNVRSTNLCYEFVLCDDYQYQQSHNFHLNDFELQGNKLELFEVLGMI